MANPTRVVMQYTFHPKENILDVLITETYDSPTDPTGSCQMSRNIYVDVSSRPTLATTLANIASNIATALSNAKVTATVNA